MTTATAKTSSRRSGAETRAAIQQVALDLFTRHGYEATSMREIADVLGIKKASLYYHFAGKEDIVRSLFDQRGVEAEELLRWVATRPQTAELAKEAVLRWVGSFSADKLRGIRFLAVNPLLPSLLEEADEDRIGSALSALAERLSSLLPHRNRASVLQLRLALLSINAAVDASAETDFTDDEIVTVAQRTATVLMDELLAAGGE